MIDANNVDGAKKKILGEKKLHSGASKMAQRVETLAIQA